MVKLNNMSHTLVISNNFKVITEITDFIVLTLFYYEICDVEYEVHVFLTSFTDNNFEWVGKIPE